MFYETMIIRSCKKPAAECVAGSVYCQSEQFLSHLLARSIIRGFADVHIFRTSDLCAVRI